MIFVVTPGFFVLALLCMLGVMQGEARTRGTTGEALAAATDADLPSRV